MPDFIIALVMFAAGVVAGLFHGRNKREHLRSLIAAQEAECKRLHRANATYAGRNKQLAEALYYRKAEK